ncbi:MAG: TonB-dependent receptor family protein [Salinivenus sp.]
MLAPPAVGQAPDSAGTDSFRVQLPEVTVEAARATETEASAPFSVTIAEQSTEEVSLTPNTSLNDVLRPFSGVWVNDRHHLALGERISIRGVGYRSNFGVRGIQVLYDGIPLTLPDGQAFLDVVDPAVVRTVELIRSPSSLFWGNGSGGVLFLSSGDPASVPSLRARVQGGSYGAWQGLVEGSASAGNWSFHGYGSGIRQDGYRDHSEGYRLRGGLHAVRSFDTETQLRLIAAGNVQDTDNPSSLTRDQFESDPTQARPAFVDVNAGKESSQLQLGAALDHTFGDTEFSGTLYGLRRALDNPLNYAFIRYERWSGGTRLSLRRTVGALEGGVGVDAALQSDDRVNYESTADGAPSGPLTLDQQETVASGAAFGYLRWNATTRLAVTGGLRANGIRFEADDRLVNSSIESADGDQSGNRAFTAWSPSVGLTFDTGPGRLFAHYGSAFETPTTTELVNRPSGQGGFNEALSPQRTDGIEVGARGAWRGAGLSYDVTVFRQWVDDQIQQAGQTPQGRDYFGNITESRHDGVELSTTWAPAPGWEAAARYTGSRFIFEDASEEAQEGNRIPGIPSHRGYLHLQRETSGWWGRLSAEGVSSFYVDDGNTEKAPRYALLNLRVGHRGLPLGTAQVKPFAAVNNLLDEQYASSVVINAFGGRFYEPGPARSLSLGVNVEW